MSPVFVSIQGNIGSGKTTLLKNMKSSYNKNKDEMWRKLRVCFLDEPVSMWNEIVDPETGETMIEKFYNDQTRYAFSFQMMAYISRLSFMRRAFRSGEYDVVISERSLETDRQIFANMLHVDGKIAPIEYSIYMKWFDEFMDDFPKEHVVYVRADPEVALQRISKRSRPGEELISIDYLRRLHEYHEKWIAEWGKVGGGVGDSGSDRPEIDACEDSDDSVRDGEDFERLLVIDGNVDMNYDDKEDREVIKRTQEVVSHIVSLSLYR